MTDATPDSLPPKTLRNGATPCAVNAGDHVFLVDGSSYIFRARHALPPLTRKLDGLPTGAGSGFCNMLWLLLRDADKTEVGVKPTHLAVVFDASSVTFRNALCDQYKVQHLEPSKDLRPKFGLIQQATETFDGACLQFAFGVDDLIAA